MIYAKTLIQNLFDENPDITWPYYILGYDVSCNLMRHLNVRFLTLG